MQLLHVCNYTLPFQVSGALTEGGTYVLLAAETYANDPRNPYAAQIAKEKAAAHH